MVQKTGIFLITIPVRQQVRLLFSMERLVDLRRKEDKLSTFTEFHGI
jgi:hypothetical protein